MSTAMSRLNAFLDSEMEQVLCFDTAIDAEKFCNEKSSVFIVMPEENPNSFFMVSLLIQQLYREILAVADENGGKLPNRAMFYCDEFGTLPTIQSAEMMYSASRSRRLSIVSIIQIYQQLVRNTEKVQRRKTAAGLWGNRLPSKRESHPAKDGGCFGGVLHSPRYPAAWTRNAESS